MNSTQDHAEPVAPAVPLRRRLLAAGWAVFLAMGLVATGSMLLPRPEGLLALGLTALGFSTFTLVRALHRGRAPSGSVSSQGLSTPLRTLYVAAYGLLAAGAVTGILAAAWIRLA